MTPARNGLRSHAVVRSRSSEAKGELGLGRARRMDVVHSARLMALATPAYPGVGLPRDPRLATGGPFPFSAGARQDGRLVLRDTELPPYSPATPDDVGMTIRPGSASRKPGDGSGGRDQGDRPTQVRLTRCPCTGFRPVAATSAVRGRRFTLRWRHAQFSGPSSPPPAAARHSPKAWMPYGHPRSKRPQNRRDGPFPRHPCRCRGRRRPVPQHALSSSTGCPQAGAPEAAGYRVLRLSWERVTADYAQTALRIRRALGAP